MAWDTETRISIINGRLSRLSFLAICSPFLFGLDWVMNHQFQNHHIRALLLSKVIAVLLAVLCMLARARWRDYGSRVDAPLFFAVFAFVIFILSIISCIFYNLFFLFMTLFVSASAALPQENIENDFGAIPANSMLERFIAFPFAAAACLLLTKGFFQSLFLKVSC